jgi:signal transduction histidine kinase
MSKVLVAEDEPALLDLFCELVSGIGHEAIAAQDGSQALELARKQHPDLLVTDLMMPGRTGADLIRALRKDVHLATVPAILLSAGRPSAADRGEAWLFLQKPVSLERFERAIQEGLELAHQMRPREAFAASPDARVSPLSLAREAMLSWVAHEIKSPLSAALTASQLAMRGLDSNEEAAPLKRRLAIIARQLVRMDELVSSILEAAQLEENQLQLDLEELDLAAWVTELVGFWKELHPDYSLLVQHTHVLVKVDRERLRQVLDNLISNAIKYGGPSKVVRVDVGASETNAFISVTDEGKGIPPEELPQIFDRFHRVAGQGGRGHGLGLYIAAALARLHGGELTVESTVGRGSTFTLSVPRR